jgi:hypothetical protein
MVDKVYLGLLIVQVSRSHSDATRSVELLWMDDRPVADTSTCQHIPLTRNRHPSPQRDSIRNTSKQATAEPRLTLRGHCGRLIGPLASDTHEYDAAMIMTEGNRQKLLSIYLQGIISPFAVTLCRPATP